MSSNKTSNRAQHSREAVPDPHPKSASYYLYFSKVSKKAGSIATKTYFQLKGFLSKEVRRVPQKRDFMEAVTNLVPKSPFTLKEQDNNKDIKEFVEKSNEVLSEARTVFPFTLFPDTVTLDRRKLTMTQRTFYMSGRIMSIQIEEILNISINVGPFFGSLSIAIRGLTSEDHFSINYLKRSDAIHLKHMIQGYIIALKDKINLDKLNKRELIETLIELGHDSNPENVVTK